MEKLTDYNISEEQANQFFRYYQLLIKWNQFMNLTRIVEFKEVIQKHFLDSLSIVNIIDLNGVKNVIDVGTGAGFPGIPLKIVFPSLKIVLLDSLNKRVQFLKEAIDFIKLSGIEAIHGRAEDFAREDRHREGYDICVSRAVADLAVLSEYCLPFVKIGGHFIAYKSSEVENELENSKRAISLLGGKLNKCEKFCLPDSDIGRSFVDIEKINSSPKKYPRKSGIPSRNPIL